MAHSSGPNFLTFDLGTTLFKVALFDSQGKLLALERAVPPIQHPQPGWSELRSGDFVGVLTRAAEKLKATVGQNWASIAAVSFATQANTFMLMGEGGWGSRFTLWSDQRAADLTHELAAIAALPDHRHTTGMPRLSHLLALAKVLWLRRSGPPDIQLARQLLFISDFLTFELAGRPLTEAGVAGLSGACDIRSLTWRDDVLEKFDVPPIRLPPIARAGTAVGSLERAAATAFGLSPDCQFVVGCLDQYAGAIGTGTVEPGRVCETTGTVLAAVRCTDQLVDCPDVFQGPGFDPNRFFQMSFSSTSANLLEWYRNSLPDKPSFDELTRLAESAPPSDLSIEPFDDRGPIENSFRHVRPHHTPGQIVRAIMQRVAQSLKQQVGRLCQDQRLSVIRSAGGASRNDYWLQMKADTLGIPFEAMECEEPTSLGAAMLAARAIGMGDLPALAQKWIKPRATFRPK